MNCSTCKYCEDNSVFNVGMSLAIIGFPIHNFPISDFVCKNSQSEKFEEDVSEEDSCKYFEE
jgi:hypothetical protein